MKAAPDSTPHLPEETLAALAFNDAGTDASEAARAHVAVCSTCAARLDEIVRLLIEIRTSAVDEADEVFDAERLDRQRDHVLRRIDHAGRPARVIEFPHRATRERRSVQPIAVRWVAAAAAAGLVVGVFAGRMTGINPQPGGNDRLSRITAAPPAAQPAAAVGEAPRHRSDEEVLSDVEMLMSRGAVEPLKAIDALTPRFREASLKVP